MCKLIRMCFNVTADVVMFPPNTTEPKRLEWMAEFTTMPGVHEELTRFEGDKGKLIHNISHRHRAAIISRNKERHTQATQVFISEGPLIDKLPLKKDSAGLFNRIVTILMQEFKHNKDVNSLVYNLLTNLIKGRLPSLIGKSLREKKKKKN